MRYLLFILSFLIINGFASLEVSAQNLHSSSGKALKAYNEGVSLSDYFDFKNAEKNFKIAISADKNFYEAYLSLGDLLAKQLLYREAVKYYREAVKIDSMFYPPMFFSLAEAEFNTGNYPSSLLHYQVYLKQKNISEKNRSIAVRKMNNCEFALEAIKKPVPFNPVSVGSAINTTDDEYWPSITADGNTMMFTRQSKSSRNGNDPRLDQEDFYISHMGPNGWLPSTNAGAPLNTASNEGAQTLSSRGNYMYFTACDRSGGLGSCDLYFSAYENGKWSIPVNVGPPINTQFWESQPSVSADDRMLFFSSNRPGGIGGKDIWYSILDDNNKWTAPVNMGKDINTPGDEMSPFIHFDGKTLYFASDGRPGMGGFDLYFTRRTDDSTWSVPKNLGYPINTFNDEMGLVIEAGGQHAYFSSKRDDNNGKDIFYFTLDKSIQPDPVSYLKGKVYDKETGKMIRANYELVNNSLEKTTVKSVTDNEGNFLVCLPSGYNYGLNVSKPGYLFYSENFVFEGQHTEAEPFIKTIVLSPVKIGEKIQLKNVFYDTDRWELKKESVAELNSLANLLKINNDIIVEIGGYTDSTGTEEYNQVLSEKRALSVVNFLIGKGIEPDRLKYKGYGVQSPAGDNITSEGRKINRRTEVRIIGRKK